MEKEIFLHKREQEYIFLMPGEWKFYKIMILGHQYQLKTFLKQLQQ